MNIVSLRQITKKYGHTTAVDRLDLDLEQGEIFGLVGPDGAQIGVVSTQEALRRAQELDLDLVEADEFVEPPGPGLYRVDDIESRGQEEDREHGQPG